MQHLLLGVALGLALIAGTASADTLSPAASVPSAGTPNAPGSISLPAGWTSPPATPVTVSSAQLQALWQQAGAAYGIPWQVLAAINKIESNFGRNMGPSSAGAIGWMQFMPSTWERWGLDANGDGVADPWNPDDAVFAAARYLAAAGGREDIGRAVFAYNHAQWYVDEVLGLANTFAQGSPEIAFSLDRIQQRLGAAQNAVVAANSELVDTLRAARRLEAREKPWLKRAGSAPLFSDRLAARKQAVLLEAQRVQLLNRASALHSKLSSAEAELASARTASQAAAATPATGQLVGAPASEGSYVFPVGGGPSIVSVAHTHHDYPAADIVAPAGSPVYALADAIVVRAWSYPDERCGIGLTIKTGDGLVWTYCHLAVLDQGVSAGKFVSAGTPVGLVGSTGHATGPHLHLQLQPPTEWPQNQAWFEGFAGTAFTWSDAPTPHVTEPASAPVFAPLPQGAVAFTR